MNLLAEPVGVAHEAAVAVLGLEAAVRCGCAATGVGGVDQVVVDERRRVEELQGGCDADDRRDVPPAVVTEEVAGIVEALHGLPAPVAEAGAVALSESQKIPRKALERRSVVGDRGENRSTGI